ncbi:helix-turn-helix transcriptional regulator [Deinococcus cellulosilyticus]|uniref:DNA-binding transcriptional regulator n=1 Tax=Deinococcus cellulosilyticus (strain DSM 18568 / NBRC 106333 / KACC 11606 / 5516J-15) TaxID=1223518 RepID=A0A511N0H5_DEIC1|nr:transcriptional regulator [Deinococcus cellulosilyticus]GEM46309.1 DNA-binding transcriptional regulator [Deinococcus cellulosilyticus NBRC 106333 = KACC 11606]
MGHSALPRAKRLQKILELLRLKPRTCQELAERFNRSVRSIQRDIEVLKDDGEGIEDLPGDRYFIPSLPSSLSAVEALAVYAAARLLYHHAPNSKRSYLTAMEKVSALLPENIRAQYLNSTPPLQDPRFSEGLLEDVSRAWKERRVLSFQYCAPNKKPEERKLEVWFLEVSRVNLDIYAMGRDPDKDSFRTFKLSRMQHTRLLQENYTIPPDFDPSKVLNHAWGVVGLSGGGLTTIHLRFKPEAAYRIREGGYPSLHIEQELPDGGLEVSLQVGTDTDRFPLELISWVQSWGSRVEVLSPANLRERWLNEAREVARLTNDPV